jgi:membrane protease YdiL (CAAX protease family)
MDELIPKDIEPTEDHPLEELDLGRKLQRGEFPKFFDFIAMLIIIVVSQIVVSMVGVALGLQMPNVLGGEVVDIENFIGTQVVRGESFAVIYPLSMIVAFLLLYGYVYLRDGRGRVARVSTSGFNPNVILGGLIWLISVQVVVEPISLYLPVAESAAGQGFWAIVTAVIFAPVLEEFIFRGLVLESLLRRHRRLFSVIVSAALFAIVHFQPSVMFSAFVSGLVLGTIYLHTNSIFSTIILHSINNAIAFSLITLNIEDYSYRQVLGGGRLYYIVYAICFVISVVATIETWRRRKRVNRV